MEDPEHDHHHVTQTKITEQEKKKRGLEYTYLSQPCDNRYDRQVFSNQNLINLSFKRLRLKILHY